MHLTCKRNSHNKHDKLKELAKQTETKLERYKKKMYFLKQFVYYCEAHIKRRQTQTHTQKKERRE